MLLARRREHLTGEPQKFCLSPRSGSAGCSIRGFAPLLSSPDAPYDADPGPGTSGVWSLEMRRSWAIAFGDSTSPHREHPLVVVSYLCRPTVAIAFIVTSYQNGSSIANLIAACRHKLARTRTPTLHHTQRPPIPSPVAGLWSFVTLPPTPGRRSHYVSIGWQKRPQAQDSPVRRRISQVADSPGKLCFPLAPTAVSVSQKHVCLHMGASVQELQTLFPRPPSQGQDSDLSSNIGRPEVSTE